MKESNLRFQSQILTHYRYANFLSFVAEDGFATSTSWLWAKRATTAPFRYVIFSYKYVKELMQRYKETLNIQNFMAKNF